MLEYGWMYFWIASLLFGAYLIFNYHDYWVGIPLFVFGTMIFWGFILDGIISVKQRLVNTPSKEELKK